MALWLAAIGGEIIKLDLSFKASKRIKDSTGQHQFAAVLTIMNEFCQVRNLTWRERRLGGRGSQMSWNGD